MTSGSDLSCSGTRAAAYLKR